MNPLCNSVIVYINDLPMSESNPLVARSGGKSIAVPLTVTNGAYTAGDVVGGLITFPAAVSGNGKHSLLYSVKLFGVVALPLELWLFNADLATPAADNAPFALAAGDGEKFLGNIPIATTDYLAAQNSFNAATLSPYFMVKSASGVASIYAYLKHTTTTSPGTTAMKIVGDFLYVD